MKDTLTVDVYFEFICPWCLIGKRQLQSAVEKLQQTHPQVKVTIQWHGVQLLPTLPIAGVDFKEFYLNRLGSATAVSMRQVQVREAAQTVGVEIDFDRIPIMPNTAKAHHLFCQCRQLGDEHQHNLLLEALFSAYFHSSKNLSDPAVLLDIATACGYPKDQSQAILANAQSPFLSADTGGNGVPYFVFDGSFAVAGAVPDFTLYQAMLQALSSGQPNTTRQGVTA